MSKTLTLLQITKRFGGLTALDGVEDFSLSPDGQQLLVRYSAPYLPAHQRRASRGVSPKSMLD